MKSELVLVNPWMVLPFGLLLAAIALAPFFFSFWWGKHYAKVAVGLATVVVLYYLVELHAAPSVWRTVRDYLSFIALIGSLFVVSGGIHINVKGEATPQVNVVFLLIGAMVANLLGTTGASMLLIRPWLRMNKYRLTGHHVVFFIFIISNVGGCLTPIGDPPLFLGYLMGVPFSWVIQRCLPMWGVGVGFLLLMFYVLDRRNFARAPGHVRAELTGPHEQWRFEGLLNLFFLAIILGSIFIHRPPFLREALMAAAALGSYFATPKPVHDANHFNLHPIREVAILFIGIFGTMMPALDWLQSNAGRLALTSPGVFYWGAGSLSSVLDNAPTYLCFLKASFGGFLNPDVVAQVTQLVQSHGAGLANITGTHAEEIRQAFAALLKYHPADLAGGCVTADQIQVACLLGNLKLNAFITAVSVGAVFFGANTYIGNGPNFMVKAIAEQQRAHTPTFLGYVF
ncbi:MAG TPA: sodium:proton antiporter, partial [Verrucomicrobiae bacterium]|nr:sodium:proton antiporter [Verrucomicrobiae bacterium]